MKFFSICGKKYKDKTELIVKFLMFKVSYNLGQEVIFYWKPMFKEYFSKNDMKAKLKNLKAGLDKVSIEYINNFMRLSECWDGTLTKKLWSNYDCKLIEEAQKIAPKVFEEYGDSPKFDPSIFSNLYGLKDLPKEVLDKINGSTIIDIGGYTGDTACMFNKYFPKSKVYVYEPLSENIKTIKNIARKKNIENLIIPIQKGLGDKEEDIEIKFNYTEKAQITTLDSEFLASDEKIGLIKMDTEGFESAIIRGGIELIKKQKPVLAIAIYHTPEDFFEMKEKLEKMNLGYKFMIRRSEVSFPQIELVLVAY